MYELLDVGKSRKKFKTYIANHLVANVKSTASGKPSMARPADEKEKRVLQKTDSMNRRLLSNILDTLRKYKITRKNLTAENWTWVGNDTRENSTTRLEQFEFQTGNRIFSIDFEMVEFIDGQWRLLRKISFKMTSSDKQKPILECFSTMKRDPVALGWDLGRWLQAGQLDSVNRYFPTRETLQTLYKDPQQQARYEEGNRIDDTLEDIKSEQDRVARKIYRMKPGEFTVKFSSMSWERRSGSRNDMEKGRYYFRQVYEGKETRFNFKFYVTENGVYIFRLYEDDF